MGGAPTGPAGGGRREWGKPPGQDGRAFGQDAQQGYNKPVGFVKEASSQPGGRTKTDEEAEAERKEARRREEEDSFRDVSRPPFHF